MSQFSIGFIDVAPVSHPDKDALAFQCKVVNTSRRTVHILSCHFELWQVLDNETNGARRIDALSGNIRERITGPAWQLIPVFQGEQESRMKLLWHYRPEQLQEIEDVRRGAPAVFQIRAELFTHVQPVRGGEEFYDCEVPRAETGTLLQFTVPESEWIHLLERIGFRHPALDRLAWPALPPAFSRSGLWLREAWTKHRRGEVDAAIAACYKAFDCLGFNLYGPGVDKKKTLEVLMDGAEPEKREIVMELLTQMGKFYHLARHESGPPVVLNDNDSQMAVVTATALLAYLGPYYK